METKIPKSMISGVLSVMPVEVTQQRKLRSISVRDPVGVGIFRRTLNIVTYYKQAGDNDIGWSVAGWIKESLGKALAEQPMLAGRLRRKEVDGLEVVANDSGARLVESRFPASLPEFLEMVKKDKNGAEAETVFWRDIDEEDPQFSPLFYVQVTNFESGGYSIGISCSILIADVLLETDFLTNWAKSQSTLVQSQTTLKPLFHLPSLKQDLGHFLTELSRSDSVLDRGEPAIFRAKTCPDMSLDCMRKTINETRGKENADFFLFVKEEGGGKTSTEFDGVKVEVRSKDEAISDCDCGGDLEEMEVGVLGKNLAFGQGHEVTSFWVGSVSKGVVFVFPTTFGDGMSLAKIMVA